MSLTRAQQHAINGSVTGAQIPVGTTIAALQEGVVGKKTGQNYAFGFDSTALNAILASVATVTAQQTADATAGTATTVTVDNVAVQPQIWFPINASGDTPPNIQSMSYSGTTVTFTVASSIASQTYQILFV